MYELRQRHDIQFPGWSSPCFPRRVTDLAAALSALPRGWRTDDGSTLMGRLRCTPGFVSVTLQVAVDGSNWICLLFDVDRGQVRVAISGNPDDSPIVYSKGPGAAEAEVVNAIAARAALALKM